MIDIGTAVETIKEYFPKAKPKEIYKYKDKFYLIIAPEKDNDQNDPFYIVDMSNGKYRFLNPLEDLDEFNKSIEAGPIKVIH